MENPVKMDDLGIPLFLEISISLVSQQCHCLLVRIYLIHIWISQHWNIHEFNWQWLSGYLCLKNGHFNPWSLTASLPLTNGGWKTTFLLGFGNFSRGELSNFGRVKLHCLPAIENFSMNISHCRSCCVDIPTQSLGLFCPRFAWQAEKYSMCSISDIQYIIYIIIYIYIYNTIHNGS